ncbi:hypothetical protein ACFU6K_01230 [Kitasatospora sp. NPDC057512]|uniref:hypothetical protein n=1 Tax=Kitasatospora sp. NPDC057512 TaxID=3346154 RepID=UPI0036806A3A
MTALSWLSRAATTVLLTLETVAVVLYFCIAIPLFYNGIGFEDEVAPKPKAVPYVMAAAGFAMAGINAWAVRGVWRPRPGGRLLAATAGVQVLLLAFTTLSGEYLFGIFAAAALPALGSVAALAHWSGRRRAGTS